MARVRLRMDDFEDGALPEVCVSSGVRADRLYRSHLTSSPAWPFLFVLLFPFGILIAIVLRIVLTRQAEGLLPYSDVIQRHMRRARRNGWITGGVGVAVVVLGALGLSGGAIRPVFTGLIVAGAVTAFVGFVRGCFPPGSIGGKPDANGRWIALSPVSREFLEAYEQQEECRRHERRAEVTSRA